MKALHIVSLSVGLMLIGCAKPPQTLTPNDAKLVPVYASLLVMSEEFRLSHAPLDSAHYQTEVQTLLTDNGLTKEEFSNRLHSLAQQPDVFQDFQTKVFAELEHRRSKQSK